MFIIKSRRKRALALNEPLRHGSHKKPVTRRDFLAQGFTDGCGHRRCTEHDRGAAEVRGDARALSTDIEAMKVPG